MSTTTKLITEWGSLDPGVSPEEAAGLAEAITRDDLTRYRLLRRRIDPSRVLGTASETLLMAAAAANLPAVMSDVLASCSWMVDAKEKRFGRTALHFAAVNSNRSAAAMLLAAGADLEAQDREGRTPLYAALMSRADSRLHDDDHARLCSLLVASGAETRAVNMPSAFYCALATGYLRLALEVYERGIDLGAEFAGNYPPDDALGAALRKGVVRKSGRPGRLYREVERLLAPHRGTAARSSTKLPAALAQAGRL